MFRDNRWQIVFRSYEVLYTSYIDEESTYADKKIGRVTMPISNVCTIIPQSFMLHTFGVDALKSVCIIVSLLYLLTLRRRLIIRTILYCTMRSFYINSGVMITSRKVRQKGMNFSVRKLPLIF